MHRKYRSHPILPGHSWPPSLSSPHGHPLAWPSSPSGVIRRPCPHRRGSAAHPHSSSRAIEYNLSIRLGVRYLMHRTDGPSRHRNPGHRIQPEPPTRSQASSNLNFKFTYHASEIQKSSNSAGSQLAAQSIQSSRSPVGLAQQPIRSHPSALPAPPRVRGPSTLIIPGHRIRPEHPTRSQT